MDLPLDFGINCTFNVEDLIPYRGTFDTPSDLFVDEPSQDLLSESPPLPLILPKLFYAIENINFILDVRLSLLETKGCDAISLSGKESLIQKIIGLLRETSGVLIPIDWSGIRASSSSDPPRSTGSSPFHPGRIDEDIMPLRGRFDRVYFRKRRNAIL